MATREHKKKGKGGMVMGIREELLEKGMEMAVEEEGTMTGHVRQGREKWRIVGVYERRYRAETKEDGTLDER